MTVESGPCRPAQDALLALSVAVEEIALFARFRRNDALSSFLDDVADNLRAARGAVLPRPGGRKSPIPD